MRTVCIIFLALIGSLEAAYNWSGNDVARDFNLEKMSECKWYETEWFTENPAWIADGMDNYFMKFTPYPGEPRVILLERGGTYNNRSDNTTCNTFKKNYTSTENQPAKLVSDTDNLWVVLVDYDKYAILAACDVINGSNCDAGFKINVLSKKETLEERGFITEQLRTRFGSLQYIPIVHSKSCGPPGCETSGATPLNGNELFHTLVLMVTTLLLVYSG